MIAQDRNFGVIVLLDVLSARQRLIEDIDKYLIDWDSVLDRLEENIHRLENHLSGQYRIGIRTKDIFDNVQIFFPTDDPRTKHIDLAGSNPIWWSLQHSAELLTNLIRYAITKNIFLRGCMSMGYIQEYRNGYYSRAMVENADLVESIDIIGVIAGLTAMRILNSKSYSSSPKFYRFVKYRIPIKKPTRNRRNEFDRYVLVNLNSKVKYMTILMTKRLKI
jgi:hypothetical protein